MASSALNGQSEANGQLTNAQRMQLEAEQSHKASIEEVPDEDDLKHSEAPVSSSILEDSSDASAPSWIAPLSSKAAGKQKAQPASTNKIDTQSQDMFPELGGAPKAPIVAPSWGAKISNGPTNGSAPSSGIATPTSSQATPRVAPATMSIPGREQERISLSPDQLMPRNQLKKPVADVIKDVNRKSKATVTMSTGANGLIFLNATGPRDACRTALSDITNQIGSNQSIKVPIPRSARAHIIGKGGVTIKSLQERTGARIQMPRTEDVAGADDDDDATVDVMISGNALTAEMARKEVLKLAGERAAATTSKLRSIPAEFYPFLSGPNDETLRELEAVHNGVRVQVPAYHKWTSQRPPQPAAPASFTASHPENYISLTGERQAVMAARAQIERRAHELARQLAVDSFPIETGSHQFIIGQKGISAHEFQRETGCHVIFPSDPEDDTITVVGPVDKLQVGVERAMELATSMQSKSVDISRLHRNAGAIHAQNLTRYLQQRKEIERLERAHEASIVTPNGAQGYLPWQLFFRDGKAGIRAQSEINSIVNGHPPTRMTNINVDPFFYAHLRKEVAPKVHETHGVLVVIPDDEKDGQVLLVFEGLNAVESDYQVPRTQPSAAEISSFQQGLEDARKHILNLIEAQEQVKVEQIDVPQKFHEKLRRFIKREQEGRAVDQIPIRVSATGTIVTLRGPSSSVDALAQKVQAFIAQEIEDEKERGYTMSFDFPQKHANQLIGTRGTNINQLRERFDVDIQVKDGKVELTGPKAKAEAAKTHINSQGKLWADEVTHTLKVDPNFHRGIIGRGGEQITKLQDRYKVQINFPRSAKPSKDDDDNVSEAGAPASKSKRVQAPDEVIVRGPTKGADAARDEILSLLQYLKDNSFTATIVVPQSQIGSLMGAGGKVIDEIRTSTGAVINVPNSKEASGPSDQVEIQIRGTKQAVAAAKKQIEDKKSVLDSTITKNLEVDRKYHSALIGSGGATLREIISKAGGPEDRQLQARSVQFPKAGTDDTSIRVMGDEAVVDKILAAMQAIVSQRESQVTETIDVPIAKHRNLIGQGGKTKKDMEVKYGVQINIPRQGDGSTSVRISGQPSAVEEAKAYILEQVKEQEGETVLVPLSVHHTIADNGLFFRKLRNNKVIVDHDGHKIPAKPAPPTSTRSNGSSLPLITDEQDAAVDAHTWIIVPSASSELSGEIPWVLRGPSDNVSQAKDQIAAAIQRAQKNTSSGYLSLADTSKHRFIIGQKGRNIDQIRRETGCTITVPKEQGSYEPIEVLGSEEGILRAKELMLQAIQEGAASRS